MSIQPNYELAKKEAIKVLNENCIIEPPINSFELIKIYGYILSFIEFTNEKFENISGAIDFKNKKVYVNAKENIKRQNFTVAHELGHLILHNNKEDYEILYRKPINSLKLSVEEKEANCFASRLLVPYKMLEEKRKKYPSATINDLSILFAVSEDVIRYRVNDISKGYK